MEACILPKIVIEFEKDDSMKRFVKELEYRIQFTKHKPNNVTIVTAEQEVS